MSVGPILFHSSLFQISESQGEASLSLEKHREEILQGMSRGQTLPPQGSWQLPLLWSLLTPLGILGCEGEGGRKPMVDPPPPPASWKDLPVKAGDGKPYEEVEIQGDPARGQIHYHQMVHLPVAKVKTIHQENPWKFRETGLQHWRILKSLEELRPEHLFMEGVYPSEDPHQSPKIPTLDKREEIQQAFSGPLGKEPTDPQIWYLARNTAGAVYQILHPEVKTYPTMNAELRRNLMAAVKEMKERGIKPNDNHPDFLGPVKYDRERFVAKGIEEVLKNQPGAVIALVYGGGHDFSDDLSALEPKPRLTSYFFEFLRTAKYDKVKRVREGKPPQ